MKRSDFIAIIKHRSDWKVDRRRGDYFLPNGNKLSDYIRRLVESQMEVDNLAITSTGDLQWITSPPYWDSVYHQFTDYEIMIPFHENEICSFDRQESRITNLINEIVG